MITIGRVFDCNLPTKQHTKFISALSIPLKHLLINGNEPASFFFFSYPKCPHHPFKALLLCVFSFSFFRSYFFVVNGNNSTSILWGDDNMLSIWKASFPSDGDATTRKCTKHENFANTLSLTLLPSCLSMLLFASARACFPLYFSLLLSLSALLLVQWHRKETFIIALNGMCCKQWEKGRFNDIEMDDSVVFS